MVIPSFLKKHYQFKSHYTDIEGYKLHYLDVGQGPVVLLLHGNPTWSFYYRHLIDALRDSYRVIVPDYIGCGLSDHPKNIHFRAADRTRHIEKLIDYLNLEKFSLVMHDWGGAIGTGLAVRRVAAIERLVYLNTTLTETETLPAIIKIASKPIIGKFLTKTTKRFLKLTTSIGVSKKLPKDIIRCYHYPYRKSAQRTAIWDFVADIPFDASHPSYSAMLELAEKIPGLSNIQVKIIWGLKDPCFHKEMLNKVAEHFPQASVLEIPDASHLVLEDAPELTNAAIRSFLLGEQQEAKQIIGRRSSLDTNGYLKENQLYYQFTKIVNENPDNLAAIVPSFFGDTLRYTHYSFSQLNDLINKYQRGLVHLGLERKDKVLMLVPPGVDFLVLSLAVMARGAVPFYLDPGMGKNKLIACIKDISPDVFIGSPKAHLLRILKKRIFTSLRFHLWVSDWAFFKENNINFLKRFAAKPLPAIECSRLSFVAFTSGATGKPKGVEFTDSIISRQLEIFGQEFGMETGKKDLPLLGIFSLFTLALGVTSVFPEINSSKPLSLDPAKILRIIKDTKVNYSFGSPTLWNKIAEYCVRSRQKLSNLEKIFIAGAPVSEQVINRVKEVLEIGEVYTPYGATEALPVTLISGIDLNNTVKLKADSGEQGTLVGKPISGVEIKVVNIQNEKVKELPILTIGEVLVSGKNVSKHYYSAKEVDLLSKFNIDDKLWHRMGDMGYLDQNGNLYFCGRKAHIVSNGEVVYYSVPIERIFNQHDKVYRSALIQLTPSNEPAIAIEPYPQFFPNDEGEKQKFIAELKLLGASDKLTKNIKHFFFFESFPVDGRHNAKIFSDKLGVMASKIYRKLEKINKAA